MKKNSKSLASSLVFLSILCGLFLFFSGVVSAGSTSGEWQSARSGDPFDPDTWTFSPRAIAVYSEPLQEGEAFRVSRLGNHNKVGHRIYVVSESAFKASGLTIGEYIQTGAVNYQMATLLWVNRDIDHDGNTAFWRDGFKPAGWNPQWTSFNRDLHGTDEPLHFFMFDNTVWYSEGSTHEPDVATLRLDDMDSHGYSDPIMFFGYAHKRNDQTNIINAGVAPTGDKFSIVDVNLDNDCDGVSNWEDPDDNSVFADGTSACAEAEAEPCVVLNCAPPENDPIIPTPTSSTTTEAPVATTSTTTSTSTTSLPEEPGLVPEPTVTEPPEPEPSIATTTSEDPEPPEPEPSIATTTSEDPEPSEPTPPPDPTDPPPPTTEPLPTTTTDLDPPALSPGPEDCDCNDGWPWWAWFLLGNGCWMTIRYIIKHMKEDEKVE